MSFETEPTVLEISGRIPPHSIEAEQGVLSCILLDPQKSTDTCTERSVTEESFYDLRHQTIFQKTVQLISEKKVPDLIMLSQELREVDELEAIGGLTYLSNLMDAAPSAANLPYYLEILLEKQMLRGMIRVCAEHSTAAHLPDAQPLVLLDEFERAALSVRIDGGAQDKTNREVLIDLIPVLQQEHRGIYPSTIPTGLADFDHYLRGFELGDLVAVGGRPSMGKTAFALQLALNICKDHPVGIFSIEMTHESLSRRMLGNWSAFNLRHMHLAQPEDERRIIIAAAKLKDAPIYVDERSKTIREIESKARKWASTHGTKVLVVDYLQIVKGVSRQGSSDKRLEVAEITAGLKGLCKDLRVVILVLSQINREVEKRGGKVTTGGRPRLSDFQESSAIEQDADWAMFLWNGKPKEDEEEELDSDLPQKVILSIEKNRNGAKRDIPLLFDKPTGRFLNISKLDPND